MSDIIDVTVPDCRQRFEEWICDRGGVQIWRNVNLSDPDAQPQFTAYKDENGNIYEKPHWSVERGELITDIARFRFIQSFHEFRRVRIAIRRGAQGFTLKLTDASTKRVHKSCDKAKGLFGRDAVYHFEHEFAVIEIPLWEGEKIEKGRIVRNLEVEA